MNSVIVSGYVLDKTIYRKCKDDPTKMEYYFLVYSYEPFTRTNSKIPIRAYGAMADECYAHLSTNCYVEITGGLVRPNESTFYVQVKDIVYRRPKSKRIYHYTSTEFLDTFAPSKLIERLVSGQNEKKE